MTTVTRHADYPQLPPGADAEGSVDDWIADRGVTSRLVWSKPMPLPEHLTGHNVQAVVTQLADGTVYHDCESVFVGGLGWTLDDARSMAAAITAAADLVDSWTGRAHDPVIRLDDEKPAIEIRCTPFEPEHPGYAGERFIGIYYGGDEEAFVVLNADQSARLARLLTGTPPEEASAELRVARAKKAVLEAYIALKTAPGNAGDYLRAALDSISDAEEVFK
jgi:hypothetical protein